VEPLRSIDVRELGAPRSRVLTLWGHAPPRPRLAIVGARAALHRLGDLAAIAMPIVAAQGRSILSGGALGIDAAVHRAALAAGVAQLAVLPCGPDRPYPPAHAGLFAAIAAAPDSGVLFAQPEGTRPHRAMFVSRNALTVALADACLVLQADARSGSEATGRLALRRRQPVAVVMGTPGCDALVGLGARGLPAASEAFAEALAAWLRGEAMVVAWPLGLEPLRAAIAAHGRGGATLDQLGGPRAAWSLFEAAALGLVVECAPGRWGLVSPG
jgi:predicted Rossmann fold nucleotide-binding protein DprA/Smf involved in DNA uptake